MPAWAVMSRNWIFCAAETAAKRMGNRRAINLDMKCGLPRNLGDCTRPNSGVIGNAPPRSRRERHRDMFVNGLALIVVFRMLLPVLARNRLRSFVGFKAEITGLVLLRQLVVPQAV